jgi:hypothetical protein
MKLVGKAISKQENENVGIIKQEHNLKKGTY